MNVRIGKTVGTGMVLLSALVGSPAFASTATAFNASSGLGMIVTYHGDVDPGANVYASAGNAAPGGFDVPSVDVLKSFGAQYWCSNATVVDSIQFFIDYSGISSLTDTSGLRVYQSEASGLGMTYTSKSFTVASGEKRIYLSTKAYGPGSSYASLVLAKASAASSIVRNAEALSKSFAGDIMVTRDVVKFQSSGTENVLIKLFDLKGKEIATLFNGSSRAGENFISMAPFSKSLSSGRYLVSLIGGDGSAVSRFVTLF